MCLGSATSARKLSHYQARCCRWVVILLAVLGFMVPGHAQTADAFNPGLQGFLGANTLAIQPDGGILAGGNLWAIAGQAQYFLGRINGDGTADRTFSPFDKYGSKRVCGQNRSSIARLQPDGNLDTPFHAGADAPVNVLAVQTDGKILVGGTFATLDDQPRPYLGRLEPDGTLDTHFEPVLDGSIGTMVLQPDGAIVLGGSFSNVNGQPANGLCRLNPDGSLDTSFLGTVNGPVWTVALQPDGKILVGGSFTDLAGQSQTNLGRLNPDGSLDGSFTSVYNRMVTSIALQADGRMIVSGQASSGTMWVTNIARLEPDGRLDPSFEAGRRMGSWSSPAHRLPGWRAKAEPTSAVSTTPMRRCNRSLPTGRASPGSGAARAPRCRARSLRYRATAQTGPASEKGGAWPTAGRLPVFRCRRTSGSGCGGWSSEGI